MGVKDRKPPLPAPTESSTLQTSGDDIVPTELATNVSRRTDHTSVSIPEDGSPVTVTTSKRKKHQDPLLSRAAHQSQTSLLIEYFEGGKGPNVHTRPSVRVRVTPSSARKGSQSKDHIQITEANGPRKPSYTRRISLGPKGERVVESDEKSISSYTSAAEDSNVSAKHPPVEIEVMHKDQGSELSNNSVPGELRYVTHNVSDISSMPPDSMLDGSAVNIIPKRNHSRSLTRTGDKITTDTLKTPARRRSRSLSRERIAQKVIEKLSSKPRHVSGERHRHGSKTSSRSASKENILDSPRRKSSRHHRHEELPSEVESSLLTNSQASDKRRSGDQYSFKSTTSKSSINNPKLLEMVEDSIRRLILPELNALKDERKTLQNRSKFEKNEQRDSFISGSSASREELGNSLSKYASAPNVSGRPKVVLNRDENNPGTVLSGNSIKGRKEHRYDGGYESPSERTFSRGMSEETVIRDERSTPRKSSRGKDGHRLRDAAAGALVGGILTHAALKSHDSRSSIDKRERRRRRSKSHSRNGSIAESTEEVYHNHGSPTKPLRNTHHRKGSIAESAEETYTNQSSPLMSPRSPHHRHGGIAESSEEVFYKHDVPPMPFRSEINGSDLTRTSILSDRTETTSTPTSERRGAEIREVARGSPREMMSPTAGTPVRSPRASQHSLGTHHSNLSRDNIGLHNRLSESTIRDHDDHHKANLGEAALAGASAAAGAAAVHHMLNRPNGHSGSPYQPGRGLSPIQSVASYREEESEPPNRDSLHPTYSSGSLSSAGRHHHGKRSAASLRSGSSIADATFDHSNRPKGVSLEDEREVIESHGLLHSPGRSEGHYVHDPEVDAWYDREHEKNELYRHSMAESAGQDSASDGKRLTGFTDDSIDNIHAAQHVRALGLNPEYVHTPVAVESAVASLLDQSTLSNRSKFGETSYLESPREEHLDDADYYDQQHEKTLVNERGGSPLKNEIRHADHVRSASEHSHLRRTEMNSPRQSEARSLSDHEEQIHLGYSGLPIEGDPMPEIGHIRDSMSEAGQHQSESDISTNPPDIQGPMGGVRHDEHNPLWYHQSTPPRSKADLAHLSNKDSPHDSLRSAAKKMLSVAAAAGAGGIAAKELHGRRGSHDAHYDAARDYEGSVVSQEQDEVHEKIRNRNMSSPRKDAADAYLDTANVMSPSHQNLDEGYITDVHQRSPIPNHARDREISHDYEDLGHLATVTQVEDPFVTDSHAKHLSGNSHGRNSHLYEGATGLGKDRIQSKDVVALMDHLTVRDAQRNARDTEILVTLVRSAAEMRNQFEDLKRFIIEQDEIMMATGSKQHDRTVQRILGGPRPQPASTPRSARYSAEDEQEDLPTKRRNVFRRALRGLGGNGKNASDLSRIEDMLMQLLGDMDSLKAGQGLPVREGLDRQDSYNSYKNGQAALNDGYEPEGYAGTPTTSNPSGYFANPPSHSSTKTRGIDARRPSHNRVSTVLEGDEELDGHEQDVLDHQFENNQQLLSPSHEAPRGSSVPLNTPPTAIVAQGSQSNEHTPRTGATDKSRKHKSSSSSFFPKISRWSKTTASSADNNNNNNTPTAPNGKRFSGRRDRPPSEISRSGSDLAAQEYTHDPHGDDRIRSHLSLEQDKHRAQQPTVHDEDDGLDDDYDVARPPSPLIPSHVSEQPTYEAHRNSLNLQHPQPRQGPTGRYQNHLESQAQTFGGSPISPNSDQWGSNPILSRFQGANRNSGTGGGHLSPISDGGYSDVSRRNAGSNVGPPRPPKVKDDGPLIPATASSQGGQRGSFAQRVSGDSSGFDPINGSLSPGLPLQAQQVQVRKPSGPRPISISGNWSQERVRPIGGGIGALKQNRYRGSPDHVPSEEGEEEDDTF